MQQLSLYGNISFTDCDDLLDIHVLDFADICARGQDIGQYGHYLPESISCPPPSELIVNKLCEDSVSKECLSSQ